jgi:hypothetical protein
MTTVSYIVIGVIGIPVAIIGLLFVVEGIAHSYMCVHSQWFRYRSRRSFRKMGLNPDLVDEFLKEQWEKWDAEYIATGRLPE